MKKIIVFIVCVLFVSACGNKSQEDPISKLMKENDYIIVDVRTKEEYDSLHVVDSVNMPLDTINENVTLDKDKLIFVYCKSGNRSKKASDLLTSYGYRVYDLGGIENIYLPKE